MRNMRLWRALLGVDRRTVIEDIEFDQEADGAEVVVARVRLRSGVSRRCGRCGRRAPWYDRGAGRRRWRGLDWGTVQVFLEADAPRVNCPAHGPTVLAVPWARHHAGPNRNSHPTRRITSNHLSPTRTASPANGAASLGQPAPRQPPGNDTPSRQEAFLTHGRLGRSWPAIVN